jgi:hypothetical protein
MRRLAIILLALTIPAAAQETKSDETSKDGTYIASVQDRPLIFTVDSRPLSDQNMSDVEPKMKELRRTLPKRLPLTGSSNEGRCYTMHSLIVRQPDKDSDSVRTAGERTCTAASNFKLKAATPQVR